MGQTVNESPSESGEGQDSRLAIRQVLHDLNNYLTSILANLQLAERHVPEGEGLERLKKAEAAAQQAAEASLRLSDLLAAQETRA